MLIIQPTADGRLHIHNNHRSDYARDEASARSVAYNWGHTDISINKALSEMRAKSRGETNTGSWRVARPQQAASTQATPKPEPQPPAPRVEKAAPVAGPATTAELRSARRKRAASGSTTTVSAAPVSAAPVVATPPAKAPRKAKADAPPPAPETVQAAPPAPTAERAKPAPRPRPAKAAKTATEPVEALPPARDRALAHIRAGVKELLALEAETLPFARGPWSDLREMAEYISTCLEGKKPKAGWAREEK